MASVLWIVAGVASLVFGGYGMTQLLVGYHWLFFRSLLSDGQYFFFLMLTYPAGTAAAFATVVGVGTRKLNPKLSITACVLGGIATILPALLYTGLAASNPAVSSRMILSDLLGYPLVFLPMYAIGGVMIAIGVVRHRNLVHSQVP